MPITGPEAVTIGLATELVSRDGLEDAAQRLAEELAGLSTDAYRHAKAGLHSGLDNHFENELLSNGLAQATLLTSADFRDRLEAVKKARANKVRS